MGKETLVEALAPVFSALKDAEPNDGARLAERLTRELPLTSDTIRAVRDAARAGVAEGWLCDREAGGVKFSRPVKPSDASAGYSVDAVVMDRVAGPKHTHTNGEINLCFTEDGDAKFCGHREGWVVFPRGSTHVPVVTDGRMLILYFLPGGAIEFAKS
jgi:uncharacterized protein DUF4863